MRTMHRFQCFCAKINLPFDSTFPKTFLTYLCKFFLTTDDLVLWKRQTAKQREKSRAPRWKDGQMPSTLRARQAGSQELRLGLPAHSQGAFCCFPKCALAGSWNQERSWDYKQSTPTWDINVSNSSLTAKPSTHPNTNSWSRQLGFKKAFSSSK